MTEQQLLLSVREAAAELGLGRDTAYRLVREGRLRSVSVGRKVLIPRIELTAFIEREMGGGDDVSRAPPETEQAPLPGRSSEVQYWRRRF